MRATTVILWIGLLRILLSRLEAQPLYITEFMANNRSTWITTGGNYEDWVEIYNAGPSPVTLTNWYLTDLPGALISPLPFVTLPAKGFLTVRPSFNLRAGGDYLLLTNVYSQAFHLVGYFPPQLPDVSYAFPMLGEAVLTNAPTFLPPSPGRRNGSERPASLALTEINYQPVAAGAGFVPDELLQFVELKNVGTAPLNLAGYKFVKGINFAFPDLVLPPGQHVLVVSNRVAFERRYGPGLPIAGNFSGSLRNSGERLVLRSPHGEPLIDLQYQSTWYPLADGLGFTLVLRDESAAPANYDEAAAWRNSAQAGGSPGQTDPPPYRPQVVVNEILARAEMPYEDAIELLNLGTNDVDLSGWFLSDRRGTPFKFRLPEGTIIPPGGYEAFDEHAFNPFGDRSNPASFSFNGFGEDVWLFSADAARNLTGYAHGFTFGGSDPNVSLGRVLTSTGEEHLVPQSEMTFRGTNTPADFGPLVISEIMYASPSDQGLVDYVEIHNVTSEPVALYSPQLSNSWRLTGGLFFEFPDVTVPAFGYVVACGTDAIEHFRKTLRIPNDVLVFGPLLGGLSENGDLIQLLRPDRTESGTVAFRLIDEVKYLPREPWPRAAARFGGSLHRVREQDFGNDPANWRAALPNPGQPLPAGEAPVISGLLNNRAGEIVTLTASAEAEPPVRYRWGWNGTAFGATNRTLELYPNSVMAVGLFSFVVLNQSGSAAADIVVNAAEFPHEDVVPPQVSIHSPASSPILVEDSQVTLAGQASDDVGLAAVLFQENDGPINVASGGTNWTFTVSLQRQRTSVHVMALDRAGNVSGTNTVDIYWEANPNIIFLSVSGEGIITGLTNGQVLRAGQTYTLRAIPEPGQVFVQWTDGDGNVVGANPTLSITARATPWILTANFVRDLTKTAIALASQGGGTVHGLTNGQFLTLGTRHSVTARPAAGYYFAQWEDSKGNVLSQSPKFSFEVADGMKLTAVFVPSSAASAAYGTYVGWLMDPNDVSHDHAGSARITVTPAGRFSGLLRIGAERWPISGRLDEDLYGVAILNRGTPSELGIQLGFTTLVGAVSNQALHAEFDLARWMRPELSETTPLDGNYWVALTNPDVSNAPAPVLILSVQKDGRFFLRGTLPGGAPIEQRGRMTTTGQLLVHEQLYRGTGSLLGWIKLESLAPTAPATLAGQLFWSRRASPDRERFDRWMNVAITPASGKPTGPPPILTQDSVDMAVYEGQTVTLNVAVSGPAPHQYQWHRDGQALSEETGPTLVLNNVQTNQSALYQCLVVNPGGIAASREVRVVVQSSWKIAEQPATQIVRVQPDPEAPLNPKATFRVSTTAGYSSLTYQWWVRYLSNSVGSAVPIPGATEQVLTVNNVTTNNYGIYACAVSDGIFTVFSSNAVLYPLVAPTIVRAPAGKSGPPGMPVELTVEYSGFPPLFTTEWRRALAGPIATNITQQTTDSLTVLIPSELGVRDLYRVIVRSQLDAQVGISSPWTTVIAVDGTAASAGSLEADDLEAIWNLDLQEGIPPPP